MDDYLDANVPQRQLKALLARVQELSASEEVLNEIDYRVYCIDRDYELPPEYALWDMIDLHWMPDAFFKFAPADLKIIKQAMIDVGIAKRVDRQPAHTVYPSPRERTWFTHNRVAYEFWPE